MRKEITKEYLMDYWLGKFHNTSCAEIVKKHPRLCKTPKWYDKYKCTQEQHDEWYDWAINELSKNKKLPKSYVERSFGFEYLICAPNVKII